MPVYATTTAIGQREDLTDFIVNITPTETPIFSAARKVKATGRRHDWQTDSLAAAASNVQTEGDDTTTFDTLAVTTLVSAYTQIMNKNFWVSHTLEAVSKAGRDSEYAYQAEKKMKELALDTEFNIIRQTSASGSARQLTGVDAAITTNTSTAGSARDLLQDLLESIMLTIYNSGGAPNVLFCAGFQKRQISEGFTGPNNTQRVIALADKTLVNAVDYYKSSFGDLSVILDRHVPTDEVYLLEMAMWRIATLRPTKHYPLPDDGGGPRGKIEHELCVEYGNEASSGKIEDLTTS